MFKIFEIYCHSTKYVLKCLVCDVTKGTVSLPGYYLIVNHVQSVFLPVTQQTAQLLVHTFIKNLRLVAKDNKKSAVFFFIFVFVRSAVKNQTLNSMFSQSLQSHTALPPPQSEHKPLSNAINTTYRFHIILCIFYFIIFNFIHLDFLSSTSHHRAPPYFRRMPPTGGVSRSADDRSPHWTGRRRSASGGSVRPRPPGSRSCPAVVRGPGGRPCSAWWRRGER